MRYQSWRAKGVNSWDVRGVHGAAPVGFAGEYVAPTVIQGTSYYPNWNVYRKAGRTVSPSSIPVMYGTSGVTEVDMARRVSRPAGGGELRMWGRYNVEHGAHK